MANDIDSTPAPSKVGLKPLAAPGNSPAALDYARRLREGSAKGYAVCAKPLRFAALPDAVVTTYAEIGDDNCCYCFESEAEARRRLEAIPPDNRLGWVFSVKEVSYRSEKGTWDGPTLDTTGHPFAMRYLVVEQTGTVAEWRHGGTIGWRDLEASSSPEKDAWAAFQSLKRRLTRKKPAS